MLSKNTLLCHLCGSCGHAEIGWYQSYVLGKVRIQCVTMSDGIVGTVMLTHWGRDKMDAISQMTFSSAFSWMKMFEFLSKCQWNLFLGEWKQNNNKKIYASTYHAPFQVLYFMGVLLTHWGPVTQLYVSKLTSIASDNGLSPGRRQATIWKMLTFC